MNSNKSLSTKEIFDLALQNYKNNNLVKAISLYEKVLDINPKNVDAQYSIGNIFYKLGQYQKALNSYKKVVQIDTRLGLLRRPASPIRSIGHILVGKARTP